MAAKTRNNIINSIGIIVVFLLVYSIIGHGVISRYYVGIIQLTCINIILAVSLNMIVGLLGRLALGHAGFISVGAYACSLFWLNTEPLPHNMTFIAGLLLGGLVAALIGILIGIPALRLRGDYLAIITLGFGEIIRVIINFLPFTGGAKGLRGIPNFITFPSVYFIMVAFICLIFTLVKSRHGRAIIAIREDEIAAEAAGIPTTFYKVFTFAVAAFMAGVAGGLLASYNRILVPSSFGFMKSIEIIVMVVLGGMGSVTGSLIAATVLTVVPEALRAIADYRMVAYSALLISMMLFRPEGLLGRKEFSLTKCFDWLVSQYRKLLKPRAVKSSDVPDRSPDAKRTLLNISHLGMNFGGLQALEDVSLTVNSDEIVGLIGPNGAGKTTVFNLLTGVYVPTKGNITLDGMSLTGKKTYQITREGVARTFQNIRLFKGDTVIENVKTAFQCRMKYSIFSGVLRLPAFYKEELEIDRRARELLQVFDLEKLADERADSLPYGAQRKLEIARALASNPKLLLLDEPAAGMNPIETQDLMKTIRSIRSRFSVAILLIEHDMSLVMGICERILVLDYGQVIALGTPDEIRRDPKVIGAYLGGE